MGISTGFKIHSRFFKFICPTSFFFFEALTGFRHEAGYSETVSGCSRDICQLIGSIVAAALGGLRSGLALTDSSGGISIGISETEQKL